MLHRNWRFRNRRIFWWKTPCEQLRLFALMKRRCGVWQGLSKYWFHLQNEIKTTWGDSKNEIGFDFDVHHVYEQNELKTRPFKMEKCQNLRNEIKTRWGDSVNLPYWGHRTNKSRRSCGQYLWNGYGTQNERSPPVWPKFLSEQLQLFTEMKYAASRQNWNLQSWKYRTQSLELCHLASHSEIGICVAPSIEISLDSNT